MIRKIYCDLCDEVTAEDELFSHLVQAHGWHAVKVASDVGRSTEHSATIIKKKAVEFKPRLGPDNKNALISASLVNEKSSKKTPALDTKSPAYDGLFSPPSAPDKGKKTSSAVHPCPHCKKQFTLKKLSNHLRPCKVRHRLRQPAKATKSEEDTVMVTCPHCHNSMSKRNLKKHISKKCKAAAKKRQSKVVRVALPDMHSDPEIAAYMQKNPAPEQIGKFGQPQAKIKHGTYGLHSMEYDAWGKGK